MTLEPSLVTLEKACLDTLNDGVMTKDFAQIADEPEKIKVVNTEEIIDEIALRI